MSFSSVKLSQLEGEQPVDRFHRSLDGSLTPRTCQVNPLMCQVGCCRKYTHTHTHTHTHQISFQPVTDQAMIYNPVCTRVEAEARGSQILRG